MQQYAQKRKLFLNYIGTGLIFSCFLIGIGVFTLISLSAVQSDRDNMRHHTIAVLLKCEQICENLFIEKGEQCCNSNEYCLRKTECQANKVIDFDDQIHTDQLWIMILELILLVVVCSTAVTLTRCCILRSKAKEELRRFRQSLEDRMNERLLEDEEGQIDLEAMRQQDPDRFEQFIDFLIRTGQLQVVEQQPRGDPNIRQSFRGNEQLADQSCSICMEAMNDGSLIQLPRCQHLFHSNCIRRWCETNASCPVCRCNIYNDN